MIKGILLSLALISWSPDFQVSTTFGFTQRVQVNDTWEKYGFNYSLLMDCFFNDYFGFGVEVGKQNIKEGQSKPKEKNTFINTYLIAGLPIGFNFSLNAHLGFVNFWNSFEDDFFYLDFYSGYLPLLDLGFRVNYSITDHWQAGLLFDEKMGYHCISLDSDGVDEYFVFRSYSVYFGFAL